MNQYFDINTLGDVGSENPKATKTTLPQKSLKSDFDFEGKNAVNNVIKKDSGYDPNFEGKNYFSNTDADAFSTGAAAVSTLSNLHNPDEADVGGNAAKQALKWGGMGAKIGKAFGPLGALIGTGAGVVAGSIGGAITAKQMRENNRRERRMANAQESVNNASAFRNSYFHLLY